MPSIGTDGPAKSPREDPTSASSRSSRPQQSHRKLNPASGNNSVASAKSRGPSSTHTAFSGTTGVCIPSMIDKADGLVDNNKAYRVPASGAMFDHDLNVWTSTNLPKTFPDKREDVHFLEEWLTTRLSEVAATCPHNRDSSKKFSSSAAEVSQKQLEVLNKGYFEVVRQVGVNCSDRAELMLRMWRASHELFENVIRDLAQTVTEMRHTAEAWKEKHDQAHREMDILVWKQGRDMEMVMDKSKTHKSEDSAVYRDLQDELFLREKDMNLMESELSDLSIWFPNFGKYGGSVLRKQLPISLPEEARSSAEVMLPQDYFLQDMKRARYVVDTICDQRRSSVLTDASGEAIAELISEDNKAEGEGGSGSGSSSEQTSTGGMEEKKKAQAARVEEGRIRALVVDNQIQGMVLEEKEKEIRRLEEMEGIYKKRIEDLISENNVLQHRVSEGDIATSLPKIPCFLKSVLAFSVASETADLYLGHRIANSNLSIVPPRVVAVGDLQASLHKCCFDFLSNKTTLNWHIHKGSTTEQGLHVISGSAYWRLMGTMDGINGPEMRMNSFESLLSFYLMHHTRNKREARECMRKACWSVLLWKNKMGKLPEVEPDAEKTIFNYQHNHTQTLPRQLNEHEKPFVQCMSRLFGYFRDEPGNADIVHSLYFNLFMRAFSTLQRYMKSPDTGGIMNSASNLFVPSSASLIPVDKAGILVRRLFGAPKEVKLYQPVQQRRYSRAVSLSVTEKMDIFGSKKNTRVKRTWWTCLPNNMLRKISDDMALQSQKHSSAMVEAYDAIDVMWKHVYDYYLKVREILENLYVFLDSITGGPSDPMFSTMLLCFLETRDTTLSVEHKVLALEYISLSSQGRLTPKTFADTILEKPNIFLTGLHILFDDNARLRRELRREGLVLLGEFKENFIKHAAETDLSKERDYEMVDYMARNVKRLTIIGRKSVQYPTSGGPAESHPLTSGNFANTLSVVAEGSSTFEEEETSTSLSTILVDDPLGGSIDSDKQYDVLLSYAMLCFDDESLYVCDDGDLPYFLKCFDIYCAYVAMKCVSQLNEVLKSINPLVDIDGVATATRHRELHLARRSFYAWFDYVERKRQRWEEGLSDDSEDDQDEEEKEEGEMVSGGGEKKSIEEGRTVAGEMSRATSRRSGRGTQAFTSSLSMKAVQEGDDQSQEGSEEEQEGGDSDGGF